MTYSFFAAFTSMQVAQLARRNGGG